MQSCLNYRMFHISLSRVPFVRGEVLPATSSTPHLIVFSTLLCILTPSLPLLLLSSHISYHLSLGLPRLLLPNSAALFGSMSSAILSKCPYHCNLLPTSLPVKLLCTPVSSPNSTIHFLSALVTLAIFRT